MKIVFVSLMRIIPWGGSEELWFKTAKLAVENGHIVYSLTQKWDKTPDRIIGLNKIGVSAGFFSKPTYSILERVAIKVKLKEQVQEIISFIDADFYIISNGTTFDFTRNTYIMKKIMQTGRPYALISQHNFENGHVVEGASRNFAIDVFQKSVTNFFVSARNLECAERQLAYKIKNPVVISNPINIVDVSIKDFPYSKKLLMACVARLDCNIKGQDILLQALSSETWKSRNFSLKLYGAGPHLDYLNTLIKFYGLEEQVTLAGHVNDIDKIWESSQVMVLPSLNEGTPLALVEAMLSGRAALATDVGDNNKYVLDGKTGFLASVASLESLTATLEKLWLSKDELKLMGEAAFENALKNTDLEPEKLLLSTVESI
ncbi:MAG: glycosyltransferase [Janthinobacterium lividum]